MTKKQAPPDTSYVYCVVRRDLSPSQQAVQAGHALLLVGNKFLDSNTNQTPHLVLLGVDTEEDLLSLHETLVKNQVSVTLYWEEDFNNAFTSLATAPLSGDKRRLFKKYRLL